MEQPTVQEEIKVHLQNFTFYEWHSQYEISAQDLITSPGLEEYKYPNIPQVPSNKPFDQTREGFYSASSSAPNILPAIKLRWIHLPVNNIDLAQSCVQSLVGESYSDKFHSTWSRELRPAASIPPDNIPDHAWNLEPSCKMRVFDGKHGLSRTNGMANFTLFFPYLSWQRYDKIKSKVGSSSGENNRNTMDVLETTGSKERERKKEVTEVQSGKSPKKGDRHKGHSGLANRGIPIHRRRTLDQFFYPGLSNTELRDKGQTVSKWTGKDPGPNGREYAVDDSYVIIVDQLWAWVYIGSECDFLVTSFPPDDMKKFDVFLAVLKDIRNIETSREPRRISTMDIIALLVKHTTSNISPLNNRDAADVTDIYRWAIGNKTALHTERFEDYGRRPSPSDTEAMSAEANYDLDLTLQMKDIVDELNMLLLLVEKQKETLDSLQNQLSEQFLKGLDSRWITIFSRNHELGLSEGRICDERLIVMFQGVQKDLETREQNLRRLRADASQTHDGLIEFIDLQQKTASLMEARSTTKQGKAIMLFTIVTVIFVPLSFFTSYFGQNVSELTGDDKNPKSGELWRVAVPISAFIILCALVAVYIIYSRTKTQSRAKRRVCTRMMTVLGFILKMPGSKAVVLTGRRLGKILRKMLLAVLEISRKTVRSVIPAGAREWARGRAQATIGEDVEMTNLGEASQAVSVREDVQ